jgi:hypothetical protein
MYLKEISTLGEILFAFTPQIFFYSANDLIVKQAIKKID